MLDTLRQDFRFALRGLMRQPGFAAVAITTLALGLGASAAIFSVFRAVLLAPHGGFPAGAPQEIQVTGPLQDAMVCQPADRMRLAVEQGGAVMITTGQPASPDYPVRYFIDP